jgi:PilZ domain-containing protein
MPEGIEGRQRSRVKTELGIRVRQIGPPRESLEVTKTLDVSRNGVLFRTRQAYDMHSTVWVIVPYDPKSVGGDMEFPATVVRVDRAPDGTAEVALNFHHARSDRKPVNVQARSVMQVPTERRSKERSKMTLSIRVRGENETEVTQTVDISRTGVQFRATQSYTVGQRVWVAVPYKPEEPIEEIESRVVRIVERSSAQCVAVKYSRTTGIRPSED